MYLNSRKRLATQACLLLTRIMKLSLMTFSKNKKVIISSSLKYNLILETTKLLVYQKVRFR